MKQHIKKYVLIVICIILLSPVLISFFQNNNQISRQEYIDSNSKIGKFENINNEEVYYELNGNEKDPTVLLIHGFGGSTFSWIENVQTLNESGFRTLAVDLPPFGLSSKSTHTDVTQEAQAKLIIELLSKLQIKNVTVVGHSYGGGVAMYIAQIKPEIVSKLIVVDGAYNNPNDISQLKRFLTSISQITKLPVISEYIQSIISISVRESSLIKFLKSSYHEPSLLSETGEKGYTYFLKLKDWQKGYIALLSAQSNSNSIDFKSLDEKLNKKIFIVWGREDTIVPLDKGEELNRSMPSSKLIIMNNVGHLPMEEQSEKFNLILKDILKVK